MKRRPLWRVLPCAEPGCREVGRYEYDTRRDYDKAVRENRSYICSRHSMKSRVLTMDCLRAEWLSAPNREESYGRFFGNSGLIINEACYAKADEFPVGTRIKITSEVILPAAAPAAKEPQ